jgi:type I restriction-modification system DNA methylase subunit
MSLKDLTTLKGNINNGEVFTPELLVEEMLNQLPEELFISNTTTFLDPCFGTGTFLKAIVNKLKKYGHNK